jgi:riboflavin transporter FmnP
MVALSMIMQAIPFWPKDPFTGVISLDLVGVPWILAFFLYGIAGALLVSVSGFFLIIPLSQGGGVIGAFSKFFATIPGFLAPYVLLIFMKKKMKDLAKTKLAIIALLSAIVFRGLFMSIFNYYFAGPLYFWMSTEEIMEFLPPVALFLINAIIGVFDFGIAWLLAFRKKIGPLHELN